MASAAVASAAPNGGGSSSPSATGVFSSLAEVVGRRSWRLLTVRNVVLVEIRGMLTIMDMFQIHLVAKDQYKPDGTYVCKVELGRLHQ